LYQSKFILNRVSVFHLACVFCGLLLTLPLLALAEMPDFYGEVSTATNRAAQSTAPNEVIDPFSGTLNIVHEDLFIPGNGGFDLRVQRVYSSQSVYARTITANFQASNSLGTILQKRTPYGVGWSMHFGRIRLASSVLNSGGSCPSGASNSSNENNPVLETQDGQQKILFCNDYPSTYSTNAEYVTKDHWVADDLGNAEGYIVIDPHGTKYTMDYRLTGGAQPGTSEYTWYTTRIEDRHGNFITITYDTRGTGENVLFKRVQANDGRTVNFSYSNITNPERVLLSHITYSSQRWDYSFKQLSGYTDSADYDYYVLTEVDLPGTHEWEYSYYNRTAGSVGDNMLQKVTYPYGGTTTYDYEYHCFISSNCWTSGRNNSIVVESKTNGGRSVTSGTWTYQYTGANSHDTTTITGPTSREIYKHYGLWGTGSDLDGNPINYGSQNAGLWRMGLLFEKRIHTRNGSSTLQTEQYDYGSRKISNEYYSRAPYTSTRRVSDPDVFSSYMTEKRVTRDGKTYTTKYENFSDNINPHKITEIGQSTRVNTLDYYPRINGQNIVSQIDDEQYSSSTNRKITRTFDSDGNLKTENRYGVLTT